MASATLPTSIRLSEPTLRLLDKESKETARSRSFIVEEALRRHLQAAGASDQSNLKQKRLEALAELRKRADGIAVRLSSTEIEARSREFRGED
jgi:metal-responsive CopG/Arc/MetJ family transcriptional regulator